MPPNPIKTWVKQTLKKTAPYLNRFYPGRSSNTRILTYHSIGERDHEMNVTPEAFAQHMHWLSENATVISVNDAAKSIPGIAITFDDGYADNLHNAAPILNQYNFPATVYMVPGKAGETLWHNTDNEHERLMTWEELRVLESKGIAIGGHTLTHARLSDLTRDEQEHEIFECTQLLKQELDHPIESFAYPYGSSLDYNADSIAHVQEIGYTHAVSNRYGSVQPASSNWELPRIWIDRTDTLQSFIMKATGSLDILALQDSYFGIRARRVINCILGVS